MKYDQFSTDHDPILAKLSADAQQAKDDEKSAIVAYNDAWGKIHVIFDQYGEPGIAHKFIGDDGYTIARQVTDPAETIDGVKLVELLKASMTEAEYKKLWTKISVQPPRVLNQDKLIAQIKKETIQPQLALEAKVKPKGKTSRHVRESSKEDVEMREIGGLRPQLEEAVG